MLGERIRRLSLLLAGVAVAACALGHVACSSGNPAEAPNAPPPPVIASPPFRLEQRHGLWWLVSPRGRPVYSVGVSFLNEGVPRDEYDPENPGYAAWRLYPDKAAWRDAVVTRLGRWGFDTVGAWGDFETLKSAPPNGPAGEGDTDTDTGLMFTPVLHLGSTVGAPWLDMWDEKLLARMDRVARDKIVPLRDDPRVVGYYSDNELGWWNATLFKMTMEHAPTSGQRRRLVALLREHYAGDWGAALRDFHAEYAGNWAELARGGALYPRAGGRATVVMRRFLALAARRYYQLMHDTIRRYDRRALVLGDRYQSFYYPEVAAAAGPYVDAVSTNLNAAWNDGTFPRFYLDTLHRLTGRPILASEFYMTATENRSGNRNTRGVFPVVATQAARAAAARVTLDALARVPCVVGVEWFQYSDEPRHGRADGENFNFGLVDIEDRPYDALTAVFAMFDPVAARKSSAASSARPDATGGVPPAPADPFADFRLTTALKHWDRERGFVPPASDAPVADLYVCWSPKALYLGVYCLDIVEKAYYRDGRMPKHDRMLWTVRVPGRADPIQARLGGDHDPIVSDPTLRLDNLSGVDLNVRNVAVIELPASLFGKSEFKPGDAVTIETDLTTHGQAYRMRWEAALKLAP